jgi:Ser/Thr protein kinase RdoA (MazF antagonist)
MEIAVVQEFNDEIVNEAAARYGIDKEKLKLISDFENYIYEYEKDDQYYILRFTHSSHRTENLVNGELDWIFYLHKNGANVCNPVFSNNNKLVERIDAKNSYFLATAFEKAPGEPPRRNNAALWNSSLFEKWGQTVGKMHALTKNYKPSDEYPKRFELQEDDLYQNGESYIKVYGDGLVQKHRDLMKWYRSLPVSNDSYGLVQTDVHQGNFFVKDNNITVFDFDDCAYTWFMNDIAIVLFYATWRLPYDEKTRTQFAKSFLEHFLRGYKLENSLDPSWLKTIPSFLKLREIIVFTVFNKKFDLENLNVNQKALLDDMRHKIENDIPFLNIDFNSFSDLL